MIIILACGVLIAVTVFLLLDASLIRNVLGLVLFGNVINIIILLTGGLQDQLPAFIGLSGKGTVANPLPQALILTAIVISFGLLAFLSTLLWKLTREDKERSNES